jgi:hypothetical protein
MRRFPFLLRRDFSIRRDDDSWRPGLGALPIPSDLHILTAERSPAHRLHTLICRGCRHVDQREAVADFNRPER